MDMFKKVLKDCTANVGMIAALILPVIVISLALAFNHGSTMINQSNLQQTLRAAMVLPTQEYVNWRLRALSDLQNPSSPFAVSTSDGSIIKGTPSLSDEAAVMKKIQDYIVQYIKVNSSQDFSPKGLDLQVSMPKVVGDWKDTTKPVFLYVSASFKQTRSMPSSGGKDDTASAESGKILRPADDKIKPLSIMLSTPTSRDEIDAVSVAVQHQLYLLHLMGFDSNKANVRFGVLPHGQVPNCPSGGCGIYNDKAPELNGYLSAVPSTDSTVPWDGGVASNSTDVSASGDIRIDDPRGQRAVQYRLTELEGSFFSVPGRRCVSGQTVWTYHLGDSDKKCYNMIDPPKCPATGGCKPGCQSDSDYDKCVRCSGSDKYKYGECYDKANPQVYKNITWHSSCQWMPGCGNPKFGGSDAHRSGTEGYVFPETSLVFTAVNVEHPDITLVAGITYDSDDVTHTTKYLPQQNNELKDLNITVSQNWAIYQCPHKDISNPEKGCGTPIPDWKHRFTKAYSGTNGYFHPYTQMETAAANDYGDDQCIRKFKTCKGKPGTTNCTPGANRYKVTFRRKAQCAENPSGAGCEIPQGYYKFFVTPKDIRPALATAPAPDKNYALIQDGGTNASDGWSNVVPTPDGSGCRTRTSAGGGNECDERLSDYEYNVCLPPTQTLTDGKGISVWGSDADNNQTSIRIDKVIKNSNAVPAEQLLVASFAIEVGRIEEEVTIGGVVRKRSFPTGVLLDSFDNGESGGDGRSITAGDDPMDAKKVRFTNDSYGSDEVDVKEGGKGLLVLTHELEGKQIPLGKDGIGISWDETKFMAANSNVDNADTSILNNKYSAHTVITGDSSNTQKTVLVQNMATIKRINPEIEKDRKTNASHEFLPNGFQVIPNAPVNSLNYTQFSNYIKRLDSTKVFVDPIADVAHGSCLSATLAARAVASVQNASGIFIPVLKCISNDCTTRVGVTDGITHPFNWQSPPWGPEANQGYRTRNWGLQSVVCPSTSYSTNMNQCMVDSSSIAKMVGGDVFPILASKECVGVVEIQNAYNQSKTNPDNIGSVGVRGCKIGSVYDDVPDDRVMTDRNCGVRIANSIMQKYVGDEVCEGAEGSCQGNF